MSFNVRLSEQAEDTLDVIISQLNERWGNKIVDNFRETVKKALIAISKTPLIYPVAEENEEMRKCVLHKNCSMYYKVNDNVIEILYFWDNRQEPMSF